MRLPKIAIENHQFTIIVFTLLVLIGVVSYITMPRSEDPQVSPPGSSIIVLYPGANPADLEQLIIDPIEEVIHELDDIKLLNSEMEDGLATIYVEFNIGSDPDKKYSDVVQKVNSIRHELPQDILSLEMLKWSISDVNILQLALVSDSAAYSALENEAEQLKSDLEKVAGVKRVKTWAFPQQEVRVSVNLEKLAQKRISLNQIIQGIQSANANIPGGNIDIGKKRFNIQTSGDYQTLRDIENTIVHSSGTKIVRLQDIADVQMDYEDKKHIARFDGRRAVFVTVTQKEGTNIFNIRKGIQSKIDAYEANLPKNIEIHSVIDQSESVASRLNSFFSNLLQGVVLVGIVIFLALSFRASLIVMIAIPISFLIGIGFLDMSGYGLEQMSIAGLVIVLGILVDNAIVVTENVSRFLKMGHNHEESAVLGTEQIAWPIVSATATTVLAFVPMMMMGDVTGEFIRSMPVTVVFTLTASLLVALTLTPYLSSKFLKIEKIVKESRIQKALSYLIESPYRKTLDLALRRGKLLILLSIVVFVLSLALFPLVGVSFFPEAEKPQLIINIETPQGTSLDRTNEITLKVENILTSKEELKHYAANVGRSNPRIYYNIIPKHESSNHAQLVVTLKKINSDEMAGLVAVLRQDFSQFSGARVEVKELEQGPPVEAPVAIKILGENLNTLKNIAGNAEEMIRTTSGTVNINNPLSTTKTDLHVKINREKAGLYGVPLFEIDKTVRASLAGLTVSQFRDSNGKEYNIVLRLPVHEKLSIADFNKIYVISVTGTPIPLSQLASIEFKSSPLQITHYNLERNVNLTADVLSNYSVDKVTKNIIAKLDNYNWPKGYRYEIGGELESREESFGGLFRAILIALLGIFGVLVLQFRSFTQPLIVFSAIPLAVIGSIIALLVTGYSFSFTAFIGLTSLVGIVVNNSIILVDYTNRLRKEGMDIIPALKDAGETRFRPIVFTTATTIGGLLPLTLLGGTLWAPMGWTIIGGLFASTFLTLFVVPVLYKIFTKIE